MRAKLLPNTAYCRALNQQTLSGGTSMHETLWRLKLSSFVAFALQASAAAWSFGDAIGINPADEPTQ